MIVKVCVSCLDRCSFSEIRNLNNDVCSVTRIGKFIFLLATNASVWNIEFTCLFFRYERLLRRAKTEDLSEVSGIGCLYQSGVDRQGRPVVVFVGKWFPATKINLDKVRFKFTEPQRRGSTINSRLNLVFSAFKSFHCY